MKAKKLIISYTTGDIGYNISKFNKMFGTDEDSSESNINNNSDSISLEEAKNKKRYFIKPQNEFISTKKDLLRFIASHFNNNFSVYSLKRLEDNSKIEQLNNKDIVYYFDDGILRDKNKIPVIEYNLKISAEEKRKKLSNFNDSAILKNNYKDRVIGPLSESTDNLNNGKNGICCICGANYDNYGNNARPYKDGRCCDACNLHFVIPVRIQLLLKKENRDENKDTEFNNNN